MAQNTTKRQSARQLRERKQKKLYSDDWALGDEEIEGSRSFCLQDKLECPEFAAHNIVREMHGQELTVAYFQRHGFNTPLLFKEKAGLGLRVPTTTFTINDVRSCVGSRRLLDVMDVNTQKNAEMTMKDWQRYYELPAKDRLLNVISLEFSHTKLEQYVRTPSVVRQIDWVDNVWPRHLKESQTEATNLIEDMKYPKVQKYCLMSVKGCYTDFHVDFGGTSVWYHILKGGKVFWLIPPTEHNLDLYERWVLSGKQSDIFFGDTVEKCARIELRAGNTFFIPTGWIHAVYTPQDSLVFGGNFLHSFGIDKQLKIAQVEDTTKVPQKFRYPFFTEMLWYVLDRYVNCLLGRTHLAIVSDVRIPPDRPHVHLTYSELHGLKEIVMYLHMLPANKKNVPDLLKDPVGLIQDVRTLIGQHRQDNRDLAITGRSILSGSFADDSERNNHPHKNHRSPHKSTLTPTTPFKGPTGTGSPKPRHNSITTSPALNTVTPSTNNVTTTNTVISPPSTQQQSLSLGGQQQQQQLQQSQLLLGQQQQSQGIVAGAAGGGNNTAAMTVTAASGVTSTGGVGVPPGDKGGGGGDKGGPRRRRTRCKKCEACQRNDCGDCSFCLDMVKFGGPGRAKQTCNMRQCLQPMLPITAACAHCGLDGWGQTPVVPLQKGPQRCGSNSGLMECSVCYEIAHPGCVQRLCTQFTGYINEDMPNSWECPICCKLGKNSDYRPRHFRARQKSSDIRRMSVSSDASSAHPGGGGGGGVVVLGGGGGAGGGHTAMLTDSDEEDEVDMDGRQVGEVKRRLEEEMDEEEKIKEEKLTKSEMSAILCSLSEPQQRLDTKSPLSTLVAPSHQTTTPTNTNNDTPIKPELKPNNYQHHHHHHNMSAMPLKKRKSGGVGITEVENEITNANTIVGVTATLQQQQQQVAVTPQQDDAKRPCHSSIESKKQAMRMQLANQIISNTTKVLKKPMYVVRPCPTTNSNPVPYVNSVVDKRCILPVFRYLTINELYKCSLVCKTWAQFSIDPTLWRKMDFSHKHLIPEHLKGIVRRQPEHLILDWCHINKYQLPWLIQRLPCLRTLSLVSIQVKSVISLKSCNAAHLRQLDLSYVTGFNDSALRDVLAPSNDSARHLFTDDHRSVRWRHLHTLNLSGTDVTDIAMRYVTQYLPALHTLRLGSCARISDAGVAQLSTRPAATILGLVSLDLSHTKLVTEVSLDHLAKCSQLIRLDMRHAAQVSTQALIKFAARSDHDLQVRDIKLVDRRQVRT